jgi:hypothetical protein
MPQNTYVARVTARSAAMGCAATERLNASAMSVSNCICDGAGLLADTARRKHLISAGLLSVTTRHPKCYSAMAAIVGCPTLTLRLFITPDMASR